MGLVYPGCLGKVVPQVGAALLWVICCWYRHWLTHVTCTVCSTSWQVLSRLAQNLCNPQVYDEEGELIETTHARRTKAVGTTVTPLWHRWELLLLWHSLCVLSVFCSFTVTD